MITESEFSHDRSTLAVRAALDAASPRRMPLSTGASTTAFEIDCGDGGKLIVNRHVPNREIWVAALRGFHFRSSNPRATRVAARTCGGTGTPCMRRPDDHWLPAAAPD
jgi:frataxin-like iron-binding protein CyaY